MLAGYRARWSRRKVCACTHPLTCMLHLPQVGFTPADFGVVSDVLHIMSRSAPLFKQMARLLKNSTQNQLMTFLRRVKKVINKVGVGEAVLLPAIVEGQELLLLLLRTSERYFDVVRQSRSALCATVFSSSTAATDRLV